MFSTICYSSYVSGECAEEPPLQDGKCCLQGGSFVLYVLDKSGRRRRRAYAILIVARGRIL
jgi:hypothetical protein